MYHNIAVTQPNFRDRLANFRKEELSARDKNLLVQSLIRVLSINSHFMFCNMIRRHFFVNTFVNTLGQLKMLT